MLSIWRVTWTAVLVVVLGARAEAQTVEYLGDSTSTVIGNVGVLRFSDLCAAAFPGTNARVCTSEEIIRNAGPGPNADTDQSNQWVHPTLVGTFATGSVAVDFSGVSATPANLSCNGWTSNASTVTGLVLTTLGQFALRTCNGARQVTCCALVTSP